MISQPQNHTNNDLQAPAREPDAVARRMDVVGLMHVLGGGLAFEIMVHLASGPDCVTRMAKHLGWATSQVSQSLNLLLSHGFLSVRRVQRFRYYELAEGVDAIVANGMVRLSIPCNGGQLEFQANNRRIRPQAELQRAAS